MPGPTPFSVSTLFSQWIGRSVSFARTAAAPETTTRQLWAIYNALPHDRATVIMADLPVLGSFAGVLAGIPNATIKEHLGVTPMEELLRRDLRSPEHCLSGLDHRRPGDLDQNGR